MNAITNLIRGLQIFEKYGNDPIVEAEHDVIYAGSDGTDLSRDDKRALEALGWVEYDDSVNRWGFYP